MSYVRLACFALMALSVWGQEFRSTLSGRVLDPAGAAVPNAKVIATERETGAKYETTSSATGEYTLPFLAPGPYSISAEAPGFKKFVQTGLQVGTNQKLSQDLLLQVGSQTESVNVTSDVELLQTATASVGQVITSGQIENMPMNGRTPLTLAQLAYGVTPASDPRFTRPFDNGGPAGFSMGGGQSQSNELLLDGAPDMTRNRRVAYNPPVDAVSEVKVEAFQPDAAYGNTSGGTVNVVMKGGTNEFHGSLYEFNQVSALKSTPFFTNAANQIKPVTRFNQYGGSIGGPIWIPKLINGKNKLFFFFTYEGIKQSEPEPTFATIATAAQRNGDFSALASQQVTIFDPSTGVLNNGIITRQPFPGNQIPSNRISPIARNILGFFPQPNAPGTSRGENNYFNNAVRSDNFSSYLGRFDWNVSDKHKLFFNMRNNDRVENRGNVYQNILTGNFLSRINWGATFDDVYTLSPSLLMNTRLSWNRFNEGNSRSSNGFDFTTLGLPGYLKANSARQVFPRIAFQNYSSVGDSGGDVTPFDTFQIFENFTKISGRHTLKFGADLRQQRESSNSFGNSSGNFAFNSDWTRAASNAANAPIGQDMAGFLLGLPTGGNFQVNATRTQQAKYFAFFVQDDVRARKNLSLNVGLRYEAETGTTERFNRATSGFDPTATLGVTAAARAAYTAAPSSPLLPASAFNPVGGITFAQPGKATTYTPYKYNFSPRFGFSWTPERLGGKTVVRGGIGLYVATFGTVQVQQPGFSQQTDLVSAGGGVFLTPVATLADPYPGGILRPVGNSRGIDTFVGQNVTYQERKFGSPITWRWNFNIQRAVGKNGVFEIGYIGSDARRLTESRDLNFVPNAFLAQSSVRDQATITRLTTAVANPFRTLLPGTNLNANTINQENLLRAFPQFNGNAGVRVEGQANGYSRFHMLQTRFERRFSSGLQFLANYSFSKFTEATDRLNPGDAQLQYRIADEDRPHRFVFSGSYELPFGKGKTFLSGVNAGVDRVVNGWQLNTIYSTQAGAPVDWSTNLTYLGGNLNWVGRNLTNTFDTTRFETVAANQPDRNVRTFQRRYTAYRADKINNIDISMIKNIKLVERFTLQFRAEAFNAFNRTNFNGPELNPTNRNFGKITSAANLPRVYQLALRLRF
ncbi:MAG: carboxypeptidase regulatory-like domain-containing protein [Bryobacteraceae bacterium]|nr:carboxypeptidase regulatory-like domain-containing protein [Bryobacteraceae bacterium]